MDDAIYSYNFNLNSIRIVWKEVLIRSQANYVYPKKLNTWLSIGPCIIAVFLQIHWTHVLHCHANFETLNDVGTRPVTILPRSGCTEGRKTITTESYSLGSRQW